MKETLEQKVKRERVINELSKKVSVLIRSVVFQVEEINGLRGIPEVTVGTKHFQESNGVLREIGYCDEFGIVEFNIPLNTIGKFQWLWNPSKQLHHKYYWSWGSNGFGELNATTQMYCDLINKLELMVIDLKNEVESFKGDFVKDVWWLLFKGDSVDGVGKPDFFKRTLDKKEAMDFYKEDGKNPYSTSKVFFVTDGEYSCVFDIKDFDKF